MAVVPRLQAARELGISVSTLRRLTADGTAKVRAGGAGRGRATLYDTQIVSQLIHRPSALSNEILAHVCRGQLALTLVDALEADLTILAQVRELDRYGLPLREHHKFLQFFKQWLRTHAESHLRIRSSNKLVQK